MKKLCFYLEKMTEILHLVHKNLRTKLSFLASTPPQKFFLNIFLLRINKTLFLAKKNSLGWDMRFRLGWSRMNWPRSNSETMITLRPPISQLFRGFASWKSMTPDDMLAAPKKQRLRGERTTLSASSNLRHETLSLTVLQGLAELYSKGWKFALIIFFSIFSTYCK